MQTDKKAMAGAYLPTALFVGASGGDVGEGGPSAEVGPGHYGHAPVGLQDRRPYLLEASEALLAHRRLDLLLGLTRSARMASRRNPPS